MNYLAFLDIAGQILPPKRPLNPVQLSAVKEWLIRWTEPELDRLMEAVKENCKFYPATIAELAECAKIAGIQARRQSDNRPHEWQQTDCQKCEGEGMLAVWWSQEYSERQQVLRLHYIMPYHASGEYWARKDHDDVRTVFLCDCAAGQADTLPRGIPKWSADKPAVIYR